MAGSPSPIAACRGFVDDHDQVLQAVPEYAGGVTLEMQIFGEEERDYIQLQPGVVVQVVDCDGCGKAPEKRPTYVAWAGNAALELLDISDAMAFQAGCSARDSSNSQSSAGCKKKDKEKAARDNDFLRRHRQRRNRSVHQSYGHRPDRRG